MWQVPGKEDFCRENLIFDSTCELLGGGAQEKLLCEAEKPLEGTQTALLTCLVSPDPQVCRQGQPAGSREQLPTLWLPRAPARPRQAPALRWLRGALPGTSFFFRRFSGAGQDPGPGYLLRASSQGNPRLTQPAICGPAVPAGSWKHKQTFLCSNSKVKCHAAWRPAVYSAHSPFRSLAEAETPNKWGCPS